MLASRCYALSAQGFTLLAASELARFFKTLLEFQTLEKTVVLNFFLENAHGLFKVAVDDSDFDFLQIYRPLLSIRKYKYFQWLIYILYRTDLSYIQKMRP